MRQPSATVEIQAGDRLILRLSGRDMGEPNGWSRHAIRRGSAHGARDGSTPLPEGRARSVGSASMSRVADLKAALAEGAGVCPWRRAARNAAWP